MKSPKEIIPETSVSAIPIDVTDYDLSAVSEAALRSLVAYNASSPRLFRQAARVVRVERDENGQLLVREVRDEHMRRELAEATPWTKKRRDGSRVPVPPPVEVAKNIMATPGLPLPPLRGIACAPVFAPDGTLETVTGYISAVGLYLDIDESLVIKSVSPNPTQHDIKQAIATIDELHCDFPFISDGDRAAAFGLVILPFAMELIDAITPLHLFQSPSPGTGKGLCAAAALLPGCGPNVPMMTAGRDDDEMRKRITTALLSGRQVVFLDNVSDQLDSAALASVLTTSWWRDRILGVTREVVVRNRAIWCATANNPTVSTEIARRCVAIRIDAKRDRPFERTGWLHDDLLQWATENRGGLIHAALTILSAWIAAGRPDSEKTLGSYEKWSHVIGGALRHAGIPGFLSNLEPLYADADAEGKTWRAFTALWFERYGSQQVTTSELWELVKNSDIALKIGDKTDRSQQTLLGILLTAQRNRVFDRLRILKDDKPSQGYTHWRLDIVDLVDLVDPFHPNG